jgi:hypothetical protein
MPTCQRATLPPLRKHRESTKISAVREKVRITILRYAGREASDTLRIKVVTQSLSWIVTYLWDCFFARVTYTETSDQNRLKRELIRSYPLEDTGKLSSRLLIRVKNSSHRVMIARSDRIMIHRILSKQRRAPPQRSRTLAIHQFHPFRVSHVQPSFT